MLHKVTRRILALAACGWLVSLDASALTVGRARGGALVGRPLEITVPVTLDGGAADDPCASAEVFHGEGRVPRAPTVRWEPGAGNEGVLRVISPTPVDEPVVTVALRVGCGQGTTRRFILLSELPPPGEGLSRAAADAAPGARSVPARPALAAAATPLAAADTGASAYAVRGREAAALAQAGRAGAPLPAGRARKPEPASARPRLQLDLLDLGLDPEPVLRLSTELRTEVAADPQRRAAAAALWQALQKGADESLRDAVRLRSAERELRTLRDEAQQNASTLARLSADVERVRAERGVAAAILAGLAAVLLALLGWLGRRWYAERRVQRVGRWFEEHGESRAAPMAPRRASGPSTRPAPILREAPSVPAGLARAAASFAAGAAASPPLAPVMALAPVTSPLPVPHEEFLPSRGGLTRMVGVQELIDVHDKADFFLSIGEYDQAIAVLEAHVHDDVDTSALAWMDLLELYHSLGRRAEYERLRGEFRQRFTGNVPEFGQFAEPGASLEDYEGALGRIVALWPSAPVLEVIEESIFRKPGLPGGESFSLEAYRELVLLYHVAQDLSKEGKETSPGPCRDTEVQPLRLVALEPSAAERDRLLVPPASVRLGVDIDLDELPEERRGARELQPLDFDLDEPTTTTALDARRA